MTGTAAGVASVIGFTPDVYMPVVNGVVLDIYPGLPGYRILFTGASVIAAVGGVAAWLLVRNRPA